MSRLFRRIGIDYWVEAGRRNAPIEDAGAFVLRFGNRYRLRAIAHAIVFVFFSSIAAYHFVIEPPGLSLGIMYFGLLFPLTLFSVYSVINVATYKIKLSHDGFLLHRLFFSDIYVAWASVTSVRWYRTTSTILVTSGKRQRVQISTDLDGMYAFAELLNQTPPETRDLSVVDWMIDKL